MSNKRTHDLAGTVAGAGAAAIAARSRPVHHFFAETAGGAVFGRLGSALPDLIEPAVHSHHRDVAHSFATAGTLVAATRGAMNSWQSHFRALADEYEAKARTGDGLMSLVHWLLSLGSSFLAGLLPGAAAGYLSHLALDARTPRGIPLLSRHLA